MNWTASNGLRWSLLGLQGSAPPHLWLRVLRPVSATARATKPNLDSLLLTTARAGPGWASAASRCQRACRCNGVVRCHVSDASCSYESPLGRCDDAALRSSATPAHWQKRLPPKCGRSPSRAGAFARVAYIHTVLLRTVTSSTDAFCICRDEYNSTTFGRGFDLPRRPAGTRPCGPTVVTMQPAGA